MSYNPRLHMAKKNVTPPKSFEEGLQELEQILGDIESGGRSGWRTAWANTSGGPFSFSTAAGC